MASRALLAGCTVLGGLELVAVFLPQAVLVPLGLVTAFLALGYAGRRALGLRVAETGEEIALSVAASLGVLVGTGLLLNLVPGGLTRTSWTLAAGALLLLTSLAGLARRPNPSAVANRAIRRRFRMTYALRAAAAVALAGGSAALAVTSQSALNARSHFTELGLAGAAHDVVTVQSHEPATTAYRVVVSVAGAPTASYDLRLQPGGTWDHALARTPSRSVSVDLYRAGETEPYRHVALR